MLTKSQQITAIKAAFEAGQAIMDIYESDFEVTLKEDHSPITLADMKANAIINRYLSATGIPIISEENEKLSFTKRKDWKQCWMVDPLDGTKEFVAKNGDFTVNIALIVDGNPVYGVIYIPVTKELFVGNTTEMWVRKYTINDLEEIDDTILREGQLIKPGIESDEIIRLIGSRSHLNETTLEYARELERNGHEIEWVSRGSSLKFCLLAEGKADIYPRFSPTMEWDTAAGQAICEAAAFELIDQSTGVSMKYNRPNLCNSSFVVRRAVSKRLI